jgi:glutamate synthase domain-containing protein 2
LVAKAVGNFRKAVETGLLKIMSKMGISAVASYHGAQIFEALGIHPDVVGECFTGTPTRIKGVGFKKSPATFCACTTPRKETEATKLENFAFALSQRRRVARLYAVLVQAIPRGGSYRRLRNPVQDLLGSDQ